MLNDDSGEQPRLRWKRATTPSVTVVTAARWWLVRSVSETAKQAGDAPDFTNASCLVSRISGVRASITTSTSALPNFVSRSTETLTVADD